MQLAATGPREHEQPMSWARALVLATGFFFLAVMLIGQVPGFFYTTSTLGTLASFQQSCLDLALLAIGAGAVCMEVAFLFDPRPLIPPAFFALVGAVIAAIGGFFVIQVARGPAGCVSGLPGFASCGWQEYLPDVTSSGKFWPVANQPYLLNPIWFQLQSIDISAVGMIGLLTGGAMLSYALLCRPALRGRLNGALGALLVRLSMAVAIAIVAVYITMLTFAPTVILGSKEQGGGVGNVLMFLALVAALFALQVWLLPIMIGRRQQFMPATYLHGVIGLMGTIGIPLLIIWAATYPVVYWVRQWDSTQFFVQCSQKDLIPASCTFTPYTGYIITALVTGLTFNLFAMAIFFWSTRRNTVVLGATMGLVYLGLAATVLHVNAPAQVPMGLFIATAIAILAFAFAWASQREFSVERAEALGCTGQWLVLGTGVFIYLAGFAIFSMPNFFESEALGLTYVTGTHTLHDAFWALLLMSYLGGMQFILLTRRQPMSQLRKFIMWTLLVGIALELVGAIQGFHTDILSGGWDVAEGSHAVFIAGLCFQVVGIGAAVFGAGIRAASWRWFVIVAAPAAVGAIAAYLVYLLLPGDWAEIVVFCVIFSTVGAFLYAVAGPDWTFVPVTAPEHAPGGLAVSTHE